MVHYDGQPAVIVLDPAIRNWVLLPIMVVMLLVGILRHYVTSFFAQSSPTPTSSKFDSADVRQLNMVMRSVNLRRHAAHLPPLAVAARRAFFISAFKNRTYLKPKAEKPVSKNGDDDLPPMPDMSMMDNMMGAMKQNMATIIPQTLIMAFINAFFSGFLLIKLPFPLTVRFKSMLQSGIMTPDLDAAWVSSLSWYFLNLFGLGPIFRLILGQNNAADGTAALTAMNPMAAGMASANNAPSISGDVPMPEMPAAQGAMGAMMMPGMPGMPGQDTGFEKTFDSEAEYLQLMDPDKQVTWVGVGIEQRVLELLTST